LLLANSIYIFFYYLFVTTSAPALPLPTILNSFISYYPRKDPATITLPKDLKDVKMTTSYIQTARIQSTTDIYGFILDVNNVLFVSTPGPEGKGVLERYTLTDTPIIKFKKLDGTATFEATLENDRTKTIMKTSVSVKGGLSKGALIALVIGCGAVIFIIIIVVIVMKKQKKGEALLDSNSSKDQPPSTSSA